MRKRCNVIGNLKRTLKINIPHIYYMKCEFSCFLCKNKYNHHNNMDCTSDKLK